MAITDVREAIAWQARHSEEAGAPRTARVIRAELAILDTATETGRRMADWPGLSLADAMPLRIAGGLHWLHLSGTDSRLAPVYDGSLTEQAAIDAIVAELATEYDDILSLWLDGPPQTNEAGRSASVMAALLWLSGRAGSKFELIEIGASAGVNTMMERYFYDLGGTRAGPAASPMRIVPEWGGPPPPQAPVEIVAVRGCDVAPVDLTDPAEALRLKAYVWADAGERMARLDTAIALARQVPPDLVQMDAAVFVRERLAQRQEPAVARVLFHTVMWQYLPEPTRAAIEAAMAEAGAEAAPERPLAWISLETNRATFRHELTVRHWPGGAEPVLLATAHPHGAWVEWRGADD
ncbi:MAG: hypothetical protein B7Z08_11775 [Sphingomonadales bacterium 32-68-7]|nr:MAG: hypothetical protein B7Z33_05665 [Sphingomonadales bacterium 12-68-11]OYX07796.1 MAG: hypothetical protein B7Z08_11775 [Sphingomonadales bacterium 32-68-7]